MGTKLQSFTECHTLVPHLMTKYEIVENSQIGPLYLGNKYAKSGHNKKYKNWFTN